MGTVYRPKDRVNKWEMFHRLGLYPIIRKISLFAYKLDLPIGNRIYLVISITYLTRYYINDNLYNCILLFSSLVEYGSESDFILGNDERDGKRWELEYMVNHKNRRGTV